MVTAEEIRERLVALLDGPLSIEDFEDWIVAGGWNMHTSSDNAAQRLVGAVEVRLAEYSQDHLSESELREELESVLNDVGSGVHHERITFDENAVVRHSGPEYHATRTESPPQHHYGNHRFRITSPQVGSVGEAAPEEVSSLP